MIVSDEYGYVEGVRYTVYDSVVHTCIVTRLDKQRTDKHALTASSGCVYSSKMNCFASTAS